MPLTDKQRFLDMLIGAQVDFAERTTKAKMQVIELDNGGGAVATFEFTSQGMLLKFTIEKDAY